MFNLKRRAIVELRSKSCSLEDAPPFRQDRNSDRVAILLLQVKLKSSLVDNWFRRLEFLVVPDIALLFLGACRGVVSSSRSTTSKVWFKLR